MTLVIGVLCNDGIVIGGDRLLVKFRATDLKTYANKITTYQFGDGRPVIVGSAGTRQDANRALKEIDPKSYPLRESADLTEYLEYVVEPRLSAFYARLKDARGRPPEYSLVIGAINRDGSPTLATVYADGSFDLEVFSTMGVGAPLAELILRDIELDSLSVEVARFLVGYIIAKVSLVHHDVDGIVNGMDILAVRNDKPKELLRFSDADFNKVLYLLQKITFKDLPSQIQKVLMNGGSGNRGI